MLSKSILTQYNDLKIEIEKTQEQINETEESIEKLIDEGTVVDKVTGGYGGIQGFKIEGFPQKEYTKRMYLLQQRQFRLYEQQTNLIELVEQIEKEIAEIKNSRDRQVLYECFINDRKQSDVAREMFLDKSAVSRIINKYFAKK